MDSVFSALKKTESSSRDSEDKEESWLLTGSSLDCKGRLSEKTLKKNTNLPATSLRGEEGNRSCPGRNLKQCGGRLWWRGSAQHRAPAAVCQGGGRRGSLPPCVVQRGRGAPGLPGEPALPVRGQGLVLPPGGHQGEAGGRGVVKRESSHTLRTRISLHFKFQN